MNECNQGRHFFCSSQFSRFRCRRRLIYLLYFEKPKRKSFSKFKSAFSERNVNEYYTHFLGNWKTGKETAENKIYKNGLWRSVRFHIIRTKFSYQIWCALWDFLIFQLILWVHFFPSKFCKCERITNSVMNKR